MRPGVMIVLASVVDRMNDILDGSQCKVSITPGPYLRVENESGDFISVDATSDRFQIIGVDAW